MVFSAPVGDILCDGYPVRWCWPAADLRWDMVGTWDGARGQHADGGVKPGPSTPAPRDAAEERGREMGIAQGEVFLLPPSNKCGKNASLPTPCPSWSLDLPAEGITAASKPSGPS